MPSTPPAKHDPRHLRAMIDRASDLARDHEVSSVFVGIAGREGDLLAPEFIDFVESELRVEDSVFRLLRERAVLMLTDVDEKKARAILERLRADFEARFAARDPFQVTLGYYGVPAGCAATTAKEVLPAIFTPRH